MESKAAVKTAPLPKLVELADELGALQKEYDVIMAPFEGKLKRLDALRKLVREFCPAPADAGWQIMGKRFVIDLGPKANKREINIPKLFKTIGAKLFLSIASVSLAAMEEVCSAEVIASVVTEDLLGPRSIKVSERGAA